jgi:hypothetical protein
VEVTAQYLLVQVAKLLFFQEATATAKYFGLMATVQQESVVLVLLVVSCIFLLATQVFTLMT